jgi:Spy/CpxP family protein refolding chaperone
MKRLTLILLFLTFLATAFAGESQATKTTNETVKTPSKAVPGRSAGPAERKKMMEAEMMARCQEMKEQKQKMKDDMEAQDAQLTRQLAEMNGAPEHKKVDLMAAALTQMVEQRIAMDARKAKMDEEMMKHMMEHMQMGKESMSQCPMMKGM